MLPVNDQDFWTRLATGLPTSTIDIARIKGPEAIVLGYGEFHLYYYTILDPAYLQSIFQSPIPSDNCYYCETQGSDVQGLHQDINTRTALNLYIATEGDTTEFYRYDGIIPKDLTQAEPSRIKCVSQFTAHASDLYLLNVGEWHMVRKTNSVPRRFIQWGWDAAYLEILPKINL
jgi:hypothetical protein